MHRLPLLLSGMIAWLFLIAPAQADTVWPRTVSSADGVPIAYEVSGSGEPTLVFIHGWSCDGRYWRAQVPHFSENHRIITIDLAGHGHSGLQREDYSMTAFGEDVRAVVEDVDAEQVILIGHSMGGAVSLAAAALMPDRVLGLVGVDTFQDFTQSPSPEEIEVWVGPLRADFVAAAAPFVASMFVEATDAALRDWVIADMTAAPPEVAISAMENLLGFSGIDKALDTLGQLEVPVIAINADLWPTNIEGNRKRLPSFEAVIMPGTDHFLHMAEPQAFNAELARVLAEIMAATDD
ncbi:MAG: alpha/beta hydrolase [Wenzhouxiangella sp.]|nr:MAG: alpha/beta hydrolase [Wenzhouxiangella sp.]